jgi:phosphate butyryltransferase
MSLPSFTALYRDADGQAEPIAVAAAGGDDASVIEALRLACDRGWVRPIVVGPERAIRASAEAETDLDGFTIVAAEGDVVAEAAVAEVREGRARMLMKGRIGTPALLRAVLDPAAGLRTGRVVCQVVLMEVLAREGAEARRFLLADTGIRIQPTFAHRIDILRSTVEVAQALGVERPRVALMAATETVNLSMPESVQAAELQRRNEAGEFPDCLIQGPLSFDLAYAPSVAGKKQVAGAVVGAADAMVFPNLLSANLTVKAIMYTADCRFGGVLRGTAAPVVFMSRADTPGTRLNSLALALALLRHERRA